MILDDLVAATQQRVAGEKAHTSLVTMRTQAEALPIGKGLRFSEILKQPGIHIIGEVKKASPSKGLIATDFPYQQIAADYEAAGVTAISVLTEQTYFQGQLSILTQQQLEDYLALATSLGLSAIVEAHNQSEVERAVAAGAQIIGVNNRNLADFSMNLDNSSNCEQLYREP